MSAVKFDYPAYKLFEVSQIRTHCPRYDNSLVDGERRGGGGGGEHAYPRTLRQRMDKLGVFVYMLTRMIASIPSAEANHRRR